MRRSYEGKDLIRISCKISGGNVVRLRDPGAMPDSLVAKTLPKVLLDRALPEGIRSVTELWMPSTYLAGVIFVGLEPSEPGKPGDFRLKGRPDGDCTFEWSSERRVFEGENGLVGTSSL